MRDAATARIWAALALSMIGLDDASSGVELTTPIEHLITYEPDIYAPRGTPSRGKARDTAPKPKPRKKERRSARHTQRRRR